MPKDGWRSACRSRSLNEQQVVARSLDWVRRFVIGLNLCPFAARVVDNGQLGWEVSTARKAEDVYRDFLACLEGFVIVEQPETLLFVVPNALQDFDDYLDLLDRCEWAIDEADLAEQVQLASFHPDYRFDGVESEDPANHSNRSPFPMIHLLRHDSVTRATASHPDPEGIPERNCRLLREMGEEGIRRCKQKA